MHQIQLSIMLTLFLTLGHGLANADTTKRGEITGGVAHSAPDWFKESFLEIADDVDEANDSGKHVLLFFQLNGCPYCDRMLSEIFEADPLMSYIQEHFDVIAINVRGDREIAFNEELSTTEKKLSEQLNVWATPGIIFLDTNNKPVVRVDGYRSPDRFKHILRYVADKTYKQQKLATYLQQELKTNVYSLRPNELFSELTDLSSVSGPLAVIFEDSQCHDYVEFHQHTLADEAVIKELKKFTILRLDASSKAPLVDVDGNTTTPAEWASQLQMTYRPGVALFADSKLLRRYDSLLFRHHFKEGFRWISSGSYKKEDYPTYSARRTEELLAAGENIDLSR